MMRSLMGYGVCARPNQDTREGLQAIGTARERHVHLLPTRLRGRFTCHRPRETLAHFRLHDDEVPPVSELHHLPRASHD